MRAWEATLVACAAAALSAGCNHRALTLFFDGVPPPKPAVSAESRATPGQATPLTRPRTGTEHGPYAAKMCDACHASRATNSLLAPPTELCGRCHALDLSKTYVHGPIASGGCLVCHDPHASRYPHLLLSDSGAFCLHCHDRGDLDAVAAHEGVEAPCTECHEAHMSDKKYLLK